MQDQENIRGIFFDSSSELKSLIIFFQLLWLRPSFFRHQQQQPLLKFTRNVEGHFSISLQLRFKKIKFQDEVFCPVRVFYIVEIWIEGADNPIDFYKLASFFY